MDKPALDALCQIFNRQRHTHATTHTQCGNATFGFASKHFVQQRDGDPRSGAADGMAEGDRATIDIEF
jgi:hypothetical protein